MAELRVGMVSVGRIWAPGFSHRAFNSSFFLPGLPSGCSAPNAVVPESQAKIIVFKRACVDVEECSLKVVPVI
jgi:hypothetical protein